VPVLHHFGQSRGIPLVVSLAGLGSMVVGLLLASSASTAVLFLAADVKLDEAGSC
jgi:hypothetical protein